MRYDGRTKGQLKGQQPATPHPNPADDAGKQDQKRGQAGAHHPASGHARIIGGREELRPPAARALAGIKRVIGIAEHPVRLRALVEG